MPAGTPTLSDSYWLSQSPVFKNRVQTALAVYCNTVENEVPTGVTGTMPNMVHLARNNFVKGVVEPTNFANYLSQFTVSAASDANVIAAATNSTSNYTPITIGTGTASTGQSGDTASAEGGLVTSTLISNAVAASFNTYVPGI